MTFVLWLVVFVASMGTNMMGALLCQFSIQLSLCVDLEKMQICSPLIKIARSVH